MTPRKQILLVEPDTALRSEAEKIMRQAGHEVVSVDSASRAEGILTVSKFDLAVVGIQVMGDNHEPFYQNWSEDAQRTWAPFLLLCGENETVPDLPEEALVRCPFAPDDLLTKVSVFTGVAANSSPSANDSSSLFGDDAVEGALDKALGLDQIDVQESEIRVSEDSSEVKTVAKSESLVGYDAEITSVTSTQKGVSDTSKIDLAFMENKLKDGSLLGVSSAQNLDGVSLDGDFQEESFSEKPKAPNVPNVPNVAHEVKQDDHDFEWFMSEMQSDSAAPSRTKKPTAGSTKKSKPKVASKKGKPSKVADADSVFDWSDSSTSIDSANAFSVQMADAVARRVAERLVHQLNSDKFIQLIREEMQAYLKNNS